MKRTPNPNEWPPPSIFQDTDPRRGRFRKSDVVYFRCEVVGFSDQGTPYVRFINKDRSVCAGSSIVAIHPDWIVEGKAVVAELRPS